MDSRLLFASLLILLSLCSVSCERQLAVTDADKAILIQATDLIPFGYGFNKIQKHESFSKVRDIDGTITLEYEFETPDNETEHALYLAAVITISTSHSDARLEQSAEKIGMLAGLKLQGITLEEQNSFFRYGDSSSFYVLKKNGRSAGNYFTSRHGTKNYAFVMAGLYFDDPEQWKSLVEPKLKLFSAYNAKK